ncbi:START domain-containing protein [Aridibaculum aurantiacum]|uniref:START domain-containing protein n=1 Tax=Aridibaculum aurantiacum TaxID=2810307 RepID=UPI001A960F25|nr:START domain-containing protein [Aridibaculum aurantiacum]
MCKDKNGIKIYSAKEGTAKYKSIKVEAIIPGNLERLLKIMMDPNSNKDWIYRTHQSYLLQRYSNNEVLSYTETSLPWPASNRDVPLRVKMSMDEKNGSLKIYSTGVPNAIPEKAGIVRIPYFNSVWDIRYKDANTLYIIYNLQMDPGGNIPAWVTNMFVAKGPYETFVKLSELMKQPVLTAK